MAARISHIHKKISACSTEAALVENQFVCVFWPFRREWERQGFIWDQELKIKLGVVGKPRCCGNLPKLSVGDLGCRRGDNVLLGC